MRKALKLLFSLLAILLIASSIFLIWASSPQLTPTAYEKVTQYALPTASDKDSVYSIVTYNIGYLSGMTNNKAVEKPASLFKENLTKVKRLFEDLDTDIIALQEIDYKSARSYYTNQQDELSSLCYSYAAQAINWDENYVPFPYWPPSVHFGAMLSGQSILSKYPLEHHQRIVLERVPDAPFYRDALYLERLAQVAHVKLASQNVVVINVHLEAFDKPTRARQFKTVYKLFQQYKETHPTILLGDFNSQARDSNAVIQPLLEQADIGNAAFDELAIPNTFSAVDPYKRIDYIFYTKKSIELIDSKVLDSFGAASDHLPVLMEFRLK